MVRAGAMDMPMLELLRRRFTHVENGTVEAQPLASQRVIAVDDDLAAGDVGHREHSRRFFILAGLLELHPDLDLGWKPIGRLDADEFRIVFAEGFFGLEEDRAGVAGPLVSQGILDPRKDTVMPAVQVTDGLARFLDQLTGCGIEFVRQRDDGVGRNLHDAFPDDNRTVGRGARTIVLQRCAGYCRRQDRSRRYNRAMDTALLGGATLRRFLRRYWQRRPLLIRQAISGFRGLLSTRELFALAGRDDVESRLVLRERGRWSIANGPFRRVDFRALPQRNWTLLVQGVNLQLAAADALLRRFAFIPYSRLDDLLVSHAVPGGGVGPHFDSYDVFLLQGEGRRRWRIGRPRDLALKPNLPVKILERFRPEHDCVLLPGDMLYLPPAVAHDGIAIDTCSSYSIGFRAPSAQEIATSFLDWLRDRIALDGRYRDAGRAPARNPARIDRALRAYAVATLRRLAWDERMAARFLGSHLTEPKPAVVFTAPERPLGRDGFMRRAARRGVSLDCRTQLLYEERNVFINGEALAWPVQGRAALKRLADLRRLAAGDIEQGASHWLYRWYRDGYLHVD